MQSSRASYLDNPSMHISLLLAIKLHQVGPNSMKAEIHCVAWREKLSKRGEEALKLEMNICCEEARQEHRLTLCFLRSFHSLTHVGACVSLCMKWERKPQ